MQGKDTPAGVGASRSPRDKSARIARPSFDGSGWVIVLAEADALRWVLREHKMAFSSGQCRRASAIEPGDQLVLYVTRGAFHSPARDQSHLAGLARVVSPVKVFRRQRIIADRTFSCGCDLELEIALPERRGAPVRPLIQRLSFIKRKEAWGHYFRAGLIRLTSRDLQILRESVQRAAG